MNPTPIKLHPTASKTLALFLATISLAVFQVAAEPVKNFILVGLSNMLGKGIVTENNPLFPASCLAQRLFRSLQSKANS